MADTNPAVVAAVVSAGLVFAGNLAAGWVARRNKSDESDEKREETKATLLAKQVEAWQTSMAADNARLRIDNDTKGALIAELQEEIRKLKARCDEQERQAGNLRGHIEFMERQLQSRRSDSITGSIPYTEGDVEG